MRRSAVLVGLLAGLSVSDLAGQTLGTPLFKSPYRAFRTSELGGYISDPGDGYNLALEGEYRRAQPRFDFGLHLGFADIDRTDEAQFGAGIDGRILVSRHSEEFPLDVSLTGGFGALFFDGDAGFLVPLGATFGRQVLLEGSKVSFTPYVHPVIAPTFGSDRVVDDDAQFGLGLGVDISLSPRWDVRVSGALGDYEGVGVGLAWHR